MVHVLYNSTAGAHYGADKIREKIEEAFQEEQMTFTDTLLLDDKESYISKLTENDRLVIVGGDGTLNRFVNALTTVEYSFPIYCYAAGTGNDFINDVVGTETDELIKINGYIKSLPVIEVNGQTYKFINGIGYGIDGYCCEEGDKYREKHNGKAPNYTRIALKGLLGAFKPVKAKVTVDGVSEEYENVWMVPTMNGRYFGGGMMITPMQDRLNSEHEVTVAVVSSKSRLRLLTAFPKIFKGNHVTYTKLVKFIRGKEVSVEFDKPTALQIDGETVLGVKSYKVKSYAFVKEKETV